MDETEFQLCQLFPEAHEKVWCLLVRAACGITRECSLLVWQLLSQSPVAGSRSASLQSPALGLVDAGPACTTVSLGKHLLC